MPYDTPGQRKLPTPENAVALLEMLMIQAVESAKERAVVKKAGRPNRVSNQLLAAGILWCMLHGWVSQWDLWRRVSVFGIGSWAAVAVCDQAIYNRLAKHGTEVMQQLCAQISSWLWQWMAPYEEQKLAPFATRVYALDESTMRAIKRWLMEVRGVPVGDPGLLAGRLIGRFDIRRQQWVRYRGHWYSYITNCTEPLQLSGAQVVALYARRWDIELGCAPA